MFPKKLQHKLQRRIENNSFRKLSPQNELVDFSSNDYLGFSKSKTIFNKSHQYLVEYGYTLNGVSGSRLLCGNHELYTIVEEQLINIHQSEVLIFNSGYDANIGFFSAVPQRNDVILYDEYSHASIRDGIKLSNAKAYSFKHNDLADLERRLSSIRAQSRTKDDEVYVVTESVFSMDGDSPDLVEMQNLCKEYKAHLIVDEAHAVGVFGFGLVHQLGLEIEVFARIVTFGKAMGCHGAAILGSEQLKDYLINFSRSFIYTTGLSPHSLATIHMAYEELLITNANAKSHSVVQQLKENIKYFKAKYASLQLRDSFINSDSAIQCCVISGNSIVKKCAKVLQGQGFDVRPILSPTVSEGQERLRFCLHSYNTTQQIDEVLNLLSTFVRD
ncbi:MAG: 8-amino-7-oxononanoate synthase [Kordia sp.]|nr:MAG: 8-amino-7-oxononanoate synthase [Kordia sp.]